MKSIITKIIVAIITVSSFSLGFVLPTYAADTCNTPGIPAEIKAASGCTGSSDDQLRSVIISIINAVMVIIALVAVVAIIIGGVQYMTSAGEPGKVQKAKSTILYAVIGLIVVTLAAVIVNFVIEKIRNP